MRLTLNKMYKIVGCIVVCLGLSAMADTSPTPVLTDASPLPIHPKLVSGVLDNGLHYLILPNALPKGRLELRLLVKVGSLQESEEERGLAHVLEHMAFRNTRNFTHNQIATTLESFGQQFGADLNATTTFDNTHYRLTVPTDAAAVAQGWKILRDWADGIQITQAELDAEKKVVMEEWRLRANSAQDYSKLIYGKSHFADRFPIGVPARIEAATAAQVQDFYTRWYRPELMTVVVTGDQGSDQTLAQLKKAFASLEAKTGPQPEIYPLAVSEKNRYFSFRHTDYKNGYLMLTRSIKLPLSNTVAGYRQRLQFSALEGILKLRANERMAERYRAYNWMGPSLNVQVQAPCCIFSLGLAATTEPRYAEYATQALEIELMSMGRYGLSAREWALYQEEEIARLTQVQREAKKTPSNTLADGLVEYALNGQVDPYANAVEPDEEVALRIRLLKEMDLKTLEQLLKQVVFSPAKDYLYFGPPKKDTEADMAPTAGELKVAADYGNDPVMVKTADKEPLALKKMARTAGTITSEVVTPAGITVWTLSNGLTVRYQFSDQEARKVRILAISPGGLSAISPKQVGAAVAFADLMGTSLVDGLDWKDFRRTFPVNELDFKHEVGGNSHSIGGWARTKQLPLLLDGVSRAFFTGHLNESVSEWRKNKLKELEAAAADPEKVFWNQYAATVYGNDYRKLYLKPRDVENVDSEGIMAVQNTLYGSPANFQLYVLGDVDKETAKAAVLQYWASMPVKAVAPPVLAPYPYGKPDAVVASTSLNAYSTQVVMFTGSHTITPEDNEALAVWSFYLQTTMRKVLREEKGWVYSTGDPYWESTPAQAHFAFEQSLQTAPENALLARQALLDMLAEQREGKFDPVLLASARAQRKEEIRKQLNDNEDILGAISRRVLNGQDPDAFFTREARVDAISAERIAETLKRLLPVDQAYFALINPAKKK